MCFHQILYIGFKYNTLQHDTYENTSNYSMDCHIKKYGRIDNSYLIKSDIALETCIIISYLMSNVHNSILFVNLQLHEDL